MSKFTLNLEEMLSEEGMKLVGVDEQRMPIVQDTMGKRGTMNLPELLAAEGLDPAQADIQYNSPNSALDDSPLGVFDRTRMGFGNEQGKAKFLAKKFKGVATNDDGHLVVNNNGLWQRVDPSNLQADPWKFAKEMASEVGENISTGISIGATMAGAVAGSVVPGAGTIAGSAAGGAAAGALNTSLGRIVGTYEATPEEQLQDIGLEMLLSGGGQAVGMGARPVLGQLAKAGKYIGSKASSGVQQAYSMVVGKLTGITPKSIQTHFEHAPEVTRTLKSAVSKHGSVDAAQESLFRSQINTVKTLAEEADKALPRKFGEIIEGVAKKAEGRNFSPQIGELANRGLSTIDELGLGKMVKGKFAPLTAEEVANRIAQGLPAEQLSDEAVQVVSKLATTLQGYSRVGAPRGAAAVKTLSEFNHRLNVIGRDAYRSGNTELQRSVAQVSAGWRNGLSEAFEQAGLADDWAKGAQLYDKFAKSVNEGRRILGSSQKGFETMARQTGSARNTVFADDTIEGMAQLLGDRGSELQRRLVVDRAAEEFLPIMPRIGMTQFAVGTAAAGGVLSTPLTIGAIANSSPRVVSTQIRAATTGLNWLKNLDRVTLDKLLSDEKAFSTMVQTLIRIPEAEEQIKGEILNQIGVPNE